MFNLVPSCFSILQKQSLCPSTSRAVLSTWEVSTTFIWKHRFELTQTYITANHLNFNVTTNYSNLQ